MKLGKVVELLLSCRDPGDVSTDSLSAPELDWEDMNC